ncbi:hypothetical protein AMQ83_35850 [Paenibacillus riograndensis]|nr:hypothetical protein AMQ83_35850 [Paenibacillus riograndensis]
MRGKSTSDFAEDRLYGEMRGKNTSDFAGNRPYAEMRGKSTSHFAGGRLNFATAVCLQAGGRV